MCRLLFTLTKNRLRIYCCFYYAHPPEHTISSQDDRLLGAVRSKPTPLVTVWQNFLSRRTRNLKRIGVRDESIIIRHKRDSSGFSGDTDWLHEIWCNSRTKLWYSVKIKWRAASNNLSPRGTGQKQRRSSLVEVTCPVRVKLAQDLGGCNYSWKPSVHMSCAGCY